MNRISEKKVIEIEIAETDAHGIEPSEWLENHLMAHFMETAWNEPNLEANKKCTCGGSWAIEGTWLEADCEGMHIYYNVRCENYMWDDSCTEIGFADCSVVFDTTQY